MAKLLLALIVVLSLFVSCKVTKPITTGNGDSTVVVDTLVVIGDSFHFDALQKVQPANDFLTATQENNLIKVDVHHYGTWLTTGDLTQTKINSFPRNILQGVRLRFGMVDINPLLNTYRYDVIDNATKLAVDNNLTIGFQLWRNPYEQCPFFWQLSPYFVPIVKTNDTKINTYYYYLNANYLSLVNINTDFLASHINLLPIEQQKAILFWLGSFGKTGDYDDYAGTPLDSKFIISDKVWDDYVNTSAQYLIDEIKKYRLPLSAAMNPANTGSKQDYYWGIGIRYFKSGDFGHGYGGNGSGEFARRIQNFVGLDPTTCFFSESEGIQQDTSWHPQNWMAIVGESLTAWVKILSIASVDNTSAVGCAVLNKYAGEHFGRRFWMARDVIDYADSTRFKEAIYGAVIDPARLKRYQQQVANILADTTTGETVKQDKLSSLLATYINPKRVDTLQKEYRKIGYDFNPNSQYYNDGGIDLVRGDYTNTGLTLVDEENTSWGVQRVQSLSPTFGRYARRPKTGKNWYFDSQFESYSDSMHVSVTYLDTGKWVMNLKYWNGTSTQLCYFPRNPIPTKDWQTVTFTIPASKYKVDGHAFGLIFAGTSPIIAMVEIE